MFYLTKNDQQIGPFNVETLEAMLERGEAQSSDLAWREGMDGWQPLSELFDIGVDAVAAPPPQPTSAGQGSSILMKVGIGLALLMLVGGVWPTIMKTAKSVGEALDLQPPSTLLASKIHMMVDGTPVAFTSNTLTEIISFWESNGCEVSWADGGLDTWILQTTRDDPLTNKRHLTKLQLVSRNKQAIVIRGVLNDRELDEKELSLVIPALSGDLQRASNQ